MSEKQKTRGEKWAEKCIHMHTDGGVLIAHGNIGRVVDVGVPIRELNHTVDGLTGVVASIVDAACAEAFQEGKDSFLNTVRQPGVMLPIPPEPDNFRRDLAAKILIATIAGQVPANATAEQMIEGSIICADALIAKLERKHA
jgi:hypothetical protein